MERKLYKKITSNEGTLTIRELTDDWQELISYYELDEKERMQALNISLDLNHAEESSYFIAEEQVYSLDHFMVIRPHALSTWLTEFQAVADDTNTSSLLLKLSDSNDAVRLFISY